MKMKSITAALCVLTLILPVFSACTDTQADTSSEAQTSSVAESTADSDDTSESSESQSDSENESSAESETDSSSEAEAETEAEPADITPAMWVVTGENGNTITMLGSMHALTEDDYPLPEKITTAYDNADILAIECDTTETQSLNYQAALLKEMLCDSEDSFKDHVSDEGYTALSDYLETFGMDISAFDSYKPWAVSNTVDSLSLIYSGLSSDLGFDVHFMELAHESGKEIYEVESVDFQMDLLMNISDDIYDFFFRNLEGETKDTQIEALQELYEAWRTGDTDDILALSNGTEEDMAQLSDSDRALYDEYMDEMVYDRNVTMENSVKELLDGDSDVFFVVGSAHFVGDGGIIDLLEKDGYEVTRVEY